MKATSKRTSEKLIGLDSLLEIAETAIYSSYLADTIPISVILIGPSGAGKSKAIMQYKGTNGCHLTNDITSMGLQDILGGDHENKIRFLVVPDFNVVLSHRASTLQLTVANLLSVTSEGTVRIDDGREKKELKHSPIGILTAMTRDLYARIANKWAILGFSRRFMPIYYDYTLETRQKIQDSIMHGGTTLLQLIPRTMETPKKLTATLIGSYGERIKSISDELATNIGYVPSFSKKNVASGKSSFIGKQLEFTPHLALRTMARAHALRDGRKEVAEADMKFLLNLISFTRYDRPGML